MKRFISVIIALCLIFSSFSFVFGAVSDSQASSIVSDLSTIRSTLNNIYSRLGTIQGYLFDSGHSVAYWVSAINSWMQPIYSSLTSGLVSALDLEPIISGLNEVVSSGGATSYTPYLKYGDKSNSQWLSDLYSALGRLGVSNRSSVLLNSHLSLLNNYSGSYIIPRFTNSSGSMSETSYNWNDGSPLGNIGLILKLFNQSFIYNALSENYLNKSLQSVVSFSDPDSTLSFTPSSSIDGIYKYLNLLNTPLARLGYVLASDQRIEAQQASSANEQSVVDNFIDSSGSGSVSASDFGSVSGASKSFRDNFNSGVSASGVWSVFNQNYDWFSQSTADALDTSSASSSARRLKSASSVRSDTPLLDAYYSDLFDIIGVINDD